jgi:hypothetical protein
MKKLKTLFAAAAMMALPGVANATVNITDIGTSPGALNVFLTFAPAGLDNYEVNAGRFASSGVTVPGGNAVSYLSYCADLFRAYVPGTFQEMSPLSSIASNATKQAQLAALVSNFDPMINGTTPMDQNRATALQLAIWEVLGETSTSGYTVNSGVFSVTSPSAGALTLANNWLGQLNAGTLQAVAGRDVRVLFSDNNQSQIYLVPVPEPTTWALMIVGFGLIGSTIRRRRSVGTLAVA